MLIMLIANLPVDASDPTTAVGKLAASLNSEGVKLCIREQCPTARAWRMERHAAAFPEAWIKYDPGYIIGRPDLREWVEFAVQEQCDCISWHGLEPVVDFETKPKLVLAEDMQDVVALRVAKATTITHKMARIGHSPATPIGAALLNGLTFAGVPLIYRYPLMPGDAPLVKSRCYKVQMQQEEEAIRTQMQELLAAGVEQIWLQDGHGLDFSHPNWVAAITEWKAAL